MKIQICNEIYNHEHIVFGAEHYNPLGIVRSLGEYGIKPIGIFVKNDRKIASKSKYLKECFYVDSIQDGYNLLMAKFAHLEKKPFVYLSDDKSVSLFDNKYNALKDNFYFFNAKEAGGINKYLDKYTQCQLAEKCGIPIAKTWVVSKNEYPDDLVYPIMTKASISTIDNWKSDVFICNNKDDLEEAYNKIKSKRIVLQQYIKKKNELCLDGYVTCGGGYYKCNNCLDV